MMTIRPLTNEEYELELRRAFDQVFVRVQPYGAVFTSDIKLRALLYPTDFFRLGQPAFQALVKAARAVGDEELCLSLLTHVLDTSAIQHWLIPLKNPENYYSLKSDNELLENALYSPTGKWGIRVTDASYALVGGSRAFIETLFGNLPSSAEQQLQDCVTAYKSELEANRFGGPPLRSFLQHLYGMEKTQQLLWQAGVS